MIVCKSSEGSFGMRGSLTSGLHRLGSSSSFQTALIFLLLESFLTLFVIAFICAKIGLAK